MICARTYFVSAPVISACGHHHPDILDDYGSCRSDLSRWRSTSGGDAMRWKVIFAKRPRPGLPLLCRQRVVNQSFQCRTVSQSLPSCNNPSSSEHLRHSSFCVSWTALLGASQLQVCAFNCRIYLGVELFVLERKISSKMPLLHPYSHIFGRIRTIVMGDAF